MNETRPEKIYLLLLALALAAWCLHDFGRSLPAALLLGICGAAYFSPKPLFRPRLPGLLLGSALNLAFFYFVIQASRPNISVSIYSYPMIQALSQSLMVMIGLQWYSWRSQRFDWLLFSIGSLFMLSGISWQLQDHKAAFVLLALGFVLSLTLNRGFSRPQPKATRAYRARWLVLGGILLGVSLSSIRIMEYVDRHFSDILTQFLLHNDDEWSGFSGNTVLQGGKEIQLSNRIAFTVKSRRASDYWRGNVLTSYHNGRWLPQETLHLPASAPNADAGWRLFRRNPALAESGELMQVHLEEHFHGILFGPAGTTAYELPMRIAAYQNQYQLFRRELREPGYDYRVYVQDDETVPAIWDRSILTENTEIEAGLARQIRTLAQPIAGKGSALEQADRIEAWFHREFQYSLKVDLLDARQDPTLVFLRRRMPAYCSWFASGMVLMLRSLGIPAHVVSGWRSMERNSLAGVWVVREKDAHDWVEVLDTGRNLWIRFDPTPQTQLANLTSDASWSWWHLLSDGLLLRLQQLQRTLGEMSLQQQLDWIRENALGLLRQPAFYLGLLVLMGLNQWLKRRRQPGLPPAPPARLDYGGAEAELAELLAQLAAWLAVRNQELPRYQTLESWLQTLEPILSEAEHTGLSRVVSLLQACRFGAGGAHLPQLRQALAQLPIREQASQSPGQTI